MRFEKEINIYGDEAVLRRFKAAETSIAVVQGNISAIISESELVELVNSKATMYSKLASAVMDIKSLTINFSDLTTKYNTVSGQYTALDSKVAQYKASVDGLSVDIAAVQQDLNKNYSTTSEMNAAIKANVSEVSAELYAVKTNLSNNYSTTSAMNAAIKAKVDALSLTVSSTYSKKTDLAAATSRISTLETWRKEASLQITDSAIISTVISSSSYKNSVKSMITQTADEIRMKAARISWSSTYSSMTSDGRLTCTSGRIGGWNIGSNALYSGMTSYGDTAHNGVWLGTNGIACGKGRFKVNTNGDVYCNDINADRINCTGFYADGSVTFYVQDVWNQGLYTNGKLTCQTGFYCGHDIYAEGRIATPNWASPSDARLKANVEDVSETMARALLRDMQPKTYYLRKEYGTRRIGFIAQDVQAVLQKNGLDNTLFVKSITNPETGEQFLGLDYIDMIAVLWKGIQMLDQEIQKLKANR
nr:MAG TPA: endosialidase chaperone [Caudoviricetes sp.]